MQELQEGFHGEGFDYRAGSPHLQHDRLRRTIISRLHEVARDTVSQGLPRTWLDVGAGHGTFVEPVLSWGFHVTASEMSGPSLRRLEHTYGLNPRFSPVFEPDGRFGLLGDKRFSVISGISVLHHIPDYTGALRRLLSRHLATAGAFVSFQDPLWYPTQGVATRAATQLAYFLWRLPRGSYRQGAATRVRRAVKILDDANPADTVEYHVVRKGVNHHKLIELLTQHFARVAFVRYWSAQSALAQRLGEGLPLANTFGIVAQGFRGQVGIRDDG